MSNAAGVKRRINTGSISFQFFSFIAMLLAVLLMMLNIFPYVSTRDAVYQEKEKALESQASMLASALMGLERPDEENVAEVLRLLDMQGYERVTIAGGTAKPSMTPTAAAAATGWSRIC